MRQVRGREIAMVFQEPMTSLNPVLTVGRQLTEGVELHLGADHARARARAAELLQMVGIPDAARRLTEYPHQFSGGMRQRMMIAMALSCEPSARARGRAHHGARRHDPGADPGAHEAALAAARHRDADHHPQPRRRRPLRRPRQRHVRRADRRAGLGRASSTPTRATPTRSACSARCRASTRRAGRGSTRSTASRPDLSRLPPGCAFAPRCAFRVERCLVERPALRPAGDDGHVSACWEIEHLPDAHGRRRGRPVSADGAAATTAACAADGCPATTSSSRCATSSSTTRSRRGCFGRQVGRRCRPSTASASRSGAARRSASWASPAAARRRPGAASSSSSGRPAGRCASTARS